MSEVLLETEVRAEWVDYNGHMNDAEYARVFSWAVEALQARIGLDAEGRARTDTTVYTLETHICYLAQAREGQPLRVALDVLDMDSKRLHVFLRLLATDDTPLASAEQMLMAMRLDDTVGVWPDAARRRLSELSRLPRNDWPAQVGRRIGLR